MATLDDRHHTHRVLEASVDLAVGPDADPSGVRRQMIARTLEAILAALNPISADNKVAAAVDLTLSLRLRSLAEPALAILPVIIVFDHREDHGDGTEKWSRDELLAAVIRHEVERSRRGFRLETFVGASTTIRSRRHGVAAEIEICRVADPDLPRAASKTDARDASIDRPKKISARDFLAFRL